MRFRSASASRLLTALVAVGLLCASAAAKPTRLRITLGANAPVKWRGELRLRKGELTKRRPLSLDAGAAAATWIEDGVLRVDHRTPRQLDAFDVTTLADAGDTLELRLTTPEGEPLTSAAIELDAARREPQAFALGDTGRWVRVERPAVDRLRIINPIDSLVRRPGEDWSLQLRVDPPGLAHGDSIDLTVTLNAGRAGEVLWQSEPLRLGIDESGGANATVTVPLPVDEGASTITLTASEPSGYRNRFMPLNKPAKLLERRLQVAVVDRAKRPPAPTEWSEVYAYDPRTQSWADRAPRWFGLRRLPWFADGPASNVPESTRHADRSVAIRLPAAATPGDASWVAYPLPISRPGEPHAIEIDQLGEPGSRLTVALLEPDALGDLRPVGVATSHAVPRWNRGDTPRPVRVLVHPRTPAPLLVVANPSTSSVAQYGAIRMFRVRGEGASATASKTTPRPTSLLWEVSDLPHAVGASHATAASGRHETADLLTHWETARRVADRVEAAGARGAAIHVNDGGAAIYPSVLWTNVRNDLAVWDDASVDAPRPSLLELLAIEFDRRGLRLTPIIAADQPAPGQANAEAASVHAKAAEEVLARLTGYRCVDRVAVRLAAQPDATAPSATADPAVWQAVVDASNRSLAPPLLLPSSNLRWRTRVDPVVLMAASDAGVSIARPHGVIPPPGVSTPAADDAIVAFVRDATPESATGPIACREPTESLRLIESGVRLRRPDGVRSGDVRLPAVAVDPEAIAEALSDAAPIADGFLVGGGSAAGAIAPPTTRLLRTLGETAAAAGTPDSDADVDAWVTASADDHRQVVIANRTRWPREATVTLATAARCLLERTESDDSGATAEWLTPGRHAVRATLMPGEVRRWKAYATGVQVAGVAVRPSATAQRELAGAIADLRSRDTASRRPTNRVANGSFERAAEAEDAPTSWTSEGVVARSTAEAERGDAALRLRSTAQQSATVTAAPFSTPATGRLITRMAVLVESAAEDAELRIELFDPDGAYRSETAASLASLASTEAGAWQELLLPVDDLPPSDRRQLALRLTLTGEASIHVDGVSTEDTLLPLDGQAGVNVKAEKLALLRLLTAAETALAEGRLAACQRLLDGPLARYVTDHFPPLADRPSLDGDAEPLDAPAREPNFVDREPAADDEEKPAWSLGRVRDYLPGWWR